MGLSTEGQSQLMVRRVRFGRRDLNAPSRSRRGNMHPGKFWFSTIALSVTAAVLCALAIAAITSTFAFGQRERSSQPDSAPNAAKVQTATGVLTDAHCGARHPSDSGLTARDCARICVKQGSSWALVDGEKVYLIKGDSPYFDKLAGQRVRVLGTLEGSTIKVQSLEPATR